MRPLSTLAVALLLAGCGPQVERPPEEYQGDRNSMVTFTSDVDAACRRIKPAAHSGEIYGCAYFSAIVVPNPCLHSGYYAELMCHEMAHANGWRH